MGISGDFQSSLLAVTGELKEKKNRTLLKKTLVKALEIFESWRFKREEKLLPSYMKKMIKSIFSGFRVRGL